MCIYVGGEKGGRFGRMDALCNWPRNAVARVNATPRYICGLIGCSRRARCSVKV
jgi:hypothetical protein